jgi:signal transduction histidine kinase
LECNLAHTIGAAGPGSAVYPRLDPGTYWFRAVAARTDGGLNGPESTLRIVILPPLYQRAGFWLAMAVAGSAAAAGVGRIATRRRMQRTIDEIERREAMEHERARIARDLHDDIGAGLTEIAMQADRVRSAIAAGSPDDAIRRIGLVCRSAVDLTRSVDEIVWAVNPANDTLDRFANYTMNYATQFLDAAGLHARFDIPAAPMPIPLPGRVRHALFMAVREALNNAAKHAGANTIHVDLRVENGWLHVVIADDGRGFEPTGDLAAGLHEGIESMKRRMKEIGGIVILTSQPGEGSRVEFRLPLADAVPGDQS